MEAQRTRRRYDHRFRSIVHETGDIELAVRKGVPRSTARDWSRLAPSEVLTFDVASMSEQELRKEVTQLRERNARLQAILRLIVVLLKVCDVSMVRRRRPRKRVHPAKPRLGIRASASNEIWHVDTSVVRLIDGSHAYIYAVIDNYSRRILGWRVSENFDPTNTLAILLEAGCSAESDESPPTLLADNGVENKTKAIDGLVNSGALRRVLAQTEIACSNSMIEAWWRTLKHQWLFLNNLDSVCAIRRLVGFYIAEHNTHLPHSAFRGQTPDEMYFGTGTDIPGDLVSKRKEARSTRMAVNRERSCPVCL